MPCDRCSRAHTHVLPTPTPTCSPVLPAPTPACSRSHTRVLPAPTLSAPRCSTCPYPRAPPPIPACSLRPHHVLPVPTPACSPRPHHVLPGAPRAYTACPASLPAERDHPSARGLQTGKHKHGEAPAGPRRSDRRQNQGECLPSASCHHGVPCCPAFAPTCRALDTRQRGFSGTWLSGLLFKPQTMFTGSRGNMEFLFLLSAQKAEPHPRGGTPSVCSGVFWERRSRSHPLTSSLGGRWSQESGSSGIVPVAWLCV